MRIMRWIVIQRFLALIIIMILPVFILNNFSILRSKRDIASTFTTEFVQQAPVEVEKSFVVLLSVSDDSKISEKTLSSIFNQNYDNYRIILIDKTEQRDVIQSIYKVARRYNKEHLISIVRDHSDGFYHAIHSCRDDEIIVQMDSKDWLAHEHVLERINQVYSNEGVWLTYSQYLEYPSWKKGKVDPFMKKTLRKTPSSKMPWLVSPFKTYYAGLFKQLQVESHFLDTLYVSLVEVSEKHIRFIDDVLYVHSP